MASLGNNEKSAPGPDDVEVSVFGPGYGECIVVHVGQNDWIVIDSCLDPVNREPVALNYLDAIGVDVSNNVKRLIITHWDDDHIKGVAKTFARCTSAKLAVSGAFSSSEFEALLAVWRPARFVSGGSGVEEMDNVYSQLSSRRMEGHSHPSPILAFENKEIFSRLGSLLVSVKSLSPSDSSITAANLRFSHITKNASEKCRLPLIEDNHASVALSLRVGKLNLLLGGDLQMRSDRSFGWFAVIDAGPHPKHEMFKISHHGSENGHHPEVWEKLLCSEPLTIITPFIRGGVRLPSKSDCENILSRTPHAFLTAPPRPRSFRDPDRDAQKAIRESALNVHYAPSIFGQIRLRKNAVLTDSLPWSIELFKDAQPVKTYLDSL